MELMDKTFTSAEKLAIYEAIIEKSKATNRQSAVSLQELELGPDALLKRGEQLSDFRNLGSISRSKHSCGPQDLEQSSLQHLIITYNTDFQDVAQISPVYNSLLYGAMSNDFWNMAPYKLHN